LTDVLDVGDRFDNAWLAAWSRVLLGMQAIRKGRLEDGRALLEEALSRSLAAQSTGSVAMCLIAFASLAFTEGDPDRAAVLVGAADGLRRRVGIRAWPTLRQGEADLASRISQSLGPDHFREVRMAAGRLNQQQAVAAARNR
jgi:ATP/maltotriose-dependent transcriptional regulator MalT